MNQTRIIRHNPKQIRARYDKTRHRLVIAGRRGGKTTMIKDDIAEAIYSCPRGGEVFYIGPTNQQAKELIWDGADEMFWRQKWNYKALISQQCFEFTRGRKLYVIGAEKISRIRGHKVWRAYLDELAYFETPLNDVWKAVRPALSDLKGRCMAATTPNGKGTQAYDFYLDAKSKKQWAVHQWVTADNPWIPKSELEDAKLEMDEKSYKQEFMALWESFEGLAYYNFDESQHIKHQPPINEGLPLILCFDFNVNPTTLIVAQKENNLIRFKKEYSQKHSSTPSTVRSFCMDHQNLKQMPIKIRGDSAGNNRSSQTGRTDYMFVEEVLRQEGFTNITWEVQGANPAIIDRVAQVNSYLKNVVGQHRIEIDPSCKELVRDFSAQELDGRFPSDKNNLGHKADAAGYCIWWDFIISKRTEQRTIDL